jgi:hypothetical protein
LRVNLPRDGGKYSAMTAAAENATDNSTPKAIRRKRPRWLRLPSFAFCCSTTLLVCIAYFGWIIIDAQYATTVYVVRSSVGLQQLDPDPSMVAYGLWDMMWDSFRFVRRDRLPNRISPRGQQTDILLNKTQREYNEAG